ncbi:MAG: Ribonuclease P protein component [Candidatus Saccharicenans subterraneus]|uniref:Ribonuclease P protein component n=1 Tax=Candidatus Saccharicenans subterraneus TaxID=2508984 RepID=A0A3E2BPW4_9BACT|nr:MAG: Ribonuclease P protein component [Candidatus Saccharicenans subterraneum]
MDERLRPVERIRRKKDFIELYRKGRRLRGRYFHLVFQPNGLEYSRMAVVVSRKIGKATVRNRLKRLVRELFRRNKNFLPGPLDLIFIAQGDAGERNREELAADFMAVLQKLAS